MEIGEENMQNPNNGTTIAEIKLNPTSNSKPKVVVIIGPTGAGKSKLAIDLASHFLIEIINADSMQIISEALVSPFLLDDSVEDAEANCLSDSQEDEQPDLEAELMSEDYDSAYNRLKDIDPVAANRIHPNNGRKINQYLNLYARFGVIPSKLLQERTVELKIQSVYATLAFIFFHSSIWQNWGQVDNSRHDFCFLCMNASLSTLDPFVNRRVDHMVDAGLLKEVFDVYTMNANYTKGLRQAIGVREFEPFLRRYIPEHKKYYDESHVQTPSDQTLKQNIQHIVDSPDDNEWKALLTEAIEQVKLNTRRLVRRQFSVLAKPDSVELNIKFCEAFWSKRRRLNSLQMLFGWNIHYIDATKSIISGADDIWAVEVVKPSVGIIKSFLTGESSTENGSNASEGMKLTQKDLWTRHAGIRSLEAHMSGKSIHRVVTIEKEFLGLRSLEACACEAKSMYTSSAFSTVLYILLTVSSVIISVSLIHRSVSQ
ncbi:hypothetical protein RND71_013291 [Anisodus tanguticus]|uniref:Uncharacterized protein n=1 Tax=Anisodus tanguticus TaxID=243964 RepID=A0AAE1SH75_9SOLA|nr:hypothetical protein RND71_013291 [Anisodus tanguticus]